MRSPWGSEFLTQFPSEEYVLGFRIKKRILIPGCLIGIIPYIWTQMTILLVRKGLVLRGLTFKNRGHLGSRWLLFHARPYFPQPPGLIAKKVKVKLFNEKSFVSPGNRWVFMMKKSLGWMSFVDDHRVFQEQWSKPISDFPWNPGWLIEILVSWLIIIPIYNWVVKSPVQLNNMGYTP